MDARTAQVCVQNQQAAALWWQKFAGWRDVAQSHGSEIVASAATDFALRDQEDAARLYRADRTLRLGQG